MDTSASVDDSPDLAFLFAQASHVLTTELTAGLEALGISPRAFCVLSRAKAGKYTQIQLAELCNLDKTTMVVTIDELERLGLAARRPSSTDRRAHIISVTDAGERKAAEGQAIVACIHRDVLSSLPEDERRVFVGGLERLVRTRLSTPLQCERPVRRRRSA